MIIDDEYYENAVLTGTHLLMGNYAMAEGCLAAGARFFAGYPITPQSECAERMSERLPQCGGVFMQMEDEIASIAAVIGATMTGRRALTATSGPGFALMQECMSWAALLEIPIVVGNVQRVGPGSGIVTLPHHGDVTQARRGGNGDYEIIMVAPSTCQELFDLSFEAFNLADEWRVPTVIMSDALLGHIHEKVVIPSADEMRKRLRLRKYTPDERLKFAFTQADKALENFEITPLPIIGTKYFPWWIASTTHSTKSGLLTENAKQAFETIQIKSYKILKNEDKIAMVEKFNLDDADVAFMAYGIPSRTAMEAMNICRKEGLKVGFFRMKTVWPIPVTELKVLMEQVKAIIFPEINLGQIAGEIERYACVDGKKIPVHLIPHTSGLHTPSQLVSKVKEVLS